MKEDCKWCVHVLEELREDHPDWSKKRLALMAIATLEMVQQDAGCEGKNCIPMNYALRAAGMEVAALEAVNPEPPKLEDHENDQFDQVIDKYLDMQIYGCEGKFTARSRADKCGCLACRREFNSYCDMKGGDALRLKKKLTKYNEGEV